MSVPQPVFDVEPSERVRSLRKKRHERLHRSVQSARFRAIGWEMTGRLTVNLSLTLIALSTLVRLVPYYQTQLQVLEEVETSLATTQAYNKRLKADFSRSFDPAQVGHIIQENGGRESAQHIPIVFVDPSTKPPQNTAPESAASSSGD